MNSKVKKFELLRDQIKSGNLNERDHARVFFEGVNGKRVRIMSEGALEAVEEMLASMRGEEQESAAGVVNAGS